MYIQLVKKLPKLNEKTRKKTGEVSINEKPLKLEKKTRKKTNPLYNVL